MRYLLPLFLTLQVFTFSGCEENDLDPNAVPKEAYSKTLYKSFSPDGTKLLTVKELGWQGETGYTQVFIDFKDRGTGSGVYSVDTTGVDIKSYWIDDHNIVIETKKDYKNGHQKWNQVSSFGYIVYVKYIER